MMMTMTIIHAHITLTLKLIQILNTVITKLTITKIKMVLRVFV
jgi:hypothetical protein